ncbi:MAG: hypothetical protein PHO42_02135 [Candidatus Omnitrophica bacterium]|nr:hypothetical protein [Candidatus Omnitrophota bacterium]
MKKMLIIMIAFAFALGFSSFAFAKSAKYSAYHKKSQPAMETIQGTITSVDSAKNEIVVKNNKTAQDRTFVVNSKVISTLTLNEEVKVKVKEGSNNAESVTIIKTKSKKK